MRLCLACCLVTGALAHAEESGPPPEAKKAFVDGKAAFERGDYELALQLFQRAALIAPAPSLYYNIGMAYERLGRYQDSAIAFEKYLELAEPPQSDDERGFQTNLRARAAANRERAKREVPGTPPKVDPPPPTPPPATPPRVEYAPAPYGYPSPRYMYTAPPLSHQQKLDKARHHRNNGIALTVVGSVFTIGGVAATIWAATTNDIGGSGERGLVIWGTASPIVVGIPLLIPGAVAWGRWQRELSKEQKVPDDGAGERKAAVDLAAPPVAMTNGAATGALVLSTPALRF